MRYKWIVTFLALFSLNYNEIYAQKYEADYSVLIQQELGGQREVAVTSGFVDILTEEFAIEVEFANKWKEAIGQSLWYGLQTNRSPGIVLIKKEDKEQKYAIQLGAALQYGGLDQKIKVWIWPDDFDLEPGTLGQNHPENPSNQQESENRSYWLSSSTQTRHNSNCRYFEKSNGNYCSKEKGKACKICGG